MINSHSHKMPAIVHRRLRRRTPGGRGVIEAAIAVFAKHGYAAATTQQVAERAGISQAYVFRLFSNKRALFISCVETVMGRIGSAFADAAAASVDRTPDGLLLAMGRRYLELLSEPGAGLQLRSRLFMVVLDNLVVSVALPTIRVDLGATIQSRSNGRSTPTRSPSPCCS